MIIRQTPPDVPAHLGGWLTPGSALMSWECVCGSLFLRLIFPAYFILIYLSAYKPLGARTQMAGSFGAAVDSVVDDEKLSSVPIPWAGSA